MAIVTFRWAPKEINATRLDSLNRAVAFRMQEEAFALVLSTELSGRTVLRLCTINPRTTETDVEQTVAALTRAAQAVSAQFGDS
jgi:glutamate/tyrosine decarboxylase-like PLP-dependent enzyme